MDNTTLKISLFETDCSILFGTQDYSKDSTDIMMSWLAKMPLKFKALCEGKRLCNIKK